MNQTFLVALYSDVNFLSISILENLLSKNCFVNIFTDDINGWNQKTKNISGNKRFSILSAKQIKDSGNYNYSIFIGGFIKKESGYKDSKKFLSVAPYQYSKTLLIFPAETFDIYENSTLPIRDNLGVIYLSDVFGPRFDLQSNLFSSQLLNEIFINKNITTAVGEIIHPIFLGDAVRTITRWLFSFGPYGKEIVIAGPDVSPEIFWRENVKLVGNLNINTNEKLEKRSLPKGVEVKRIDCDLNFTLTETYKWFAMNGIKESKIVKTTNSRKYKKPFIKPQETIEKKPRGKPPKFLRPSVILILSILIFPFITLFLAAGSYYLYFREFINGKNPSTNFVLVAKTFSVIAVSESKIIEPVPFLGLVYRETAFIGNIGAESSGLVIDSMDLVKRGGEMFSKTLGDQIYDPKEISHEIKSDLDSIYQEISFLEADTKAEAASGTRTAVLLNKKFDFEKAKNLTSSGSAIADRLPAILGSQGRKTYLILFQNNMELRPTGGFIGSYGLLTFDGGRLSDMSVNDVYSADGQLNGHVEPPVPIKNYLGEANWWLRDSNWDPDFPTSAKRAEWFLDKEVNQDVDGVIAIDLAPIKEILNYTGPVFLADYNLNIDSDNLYQKTQSEVQDNFFPGTHKKASFLTALSQNLLGQLGKMNGDKEMGILKSIFQSLEGRHIQIFLHDDSQDAISKINWDGKIGTPDCGDNCYSDMVGLVEANLGVNKADYFIKRSVNMEVGINEQKITRSLTLRLNNSANPALGLAGRYKDYARIFVPSDATNINVKDVTNGIGQSFTPDINDNRGNKEIGILVEVLGGQTKDIMFTWDTTTNLSSSQDYGIYVRKQAGIDSYPLSLTVNGKSIYNSLLTQDIWMQKF